MRSALREPYLHAFTAAVCAVGVGAWSTGVYGLDSALTWFYRLQPRVLAPTPVCVLLGLAWLVLTIVALRQSDARPGRGLLALIGASLSLQWMNILLVDGTFGTILGRFEGGHGEFFHVVANHRDDLWRVLHDYEQLCSTGALGAFAPSKPPGILLIYAAIDALGRLESFEALARPLIEVFAVRPALSAHPQAIAAAIVLFPLMTALTNVGLWFSAKSIGFSRQQAACACALWSSCPAVIAIDFHTDGAVFPSAVMLATALTCVSANARGRARPFILALSGGAVFTLGCYANFSMLPAAPVVAGLVWIATRGRWRKFVGAALGALTGGALVQAFLAFVLGYQHPFVRMHAAYEYHLGWKAHCVGGWRFGGVGLGEFLVYVGAPLVVVWVGMAVFGRSRGGLSRRAIPRALLAFVLALAWINGSNEVARIWLFLVPFIALAAVEGFSRLKTGASLRFATGLCVANLIILIVMRATQPW